MKGLNPPPSPRPVSSRPSVQVGEEGQTVLFLPPCAVVLCQDGALSPLLHLALSARNPSVKK